MARINCNIILFIISTFHNIKHLLLTHADTLTRGWVFVCTMINFVAYHVLNIQIYSLKFMVQQYTDIYACRL